jgi:hypothetical protein
VSFCPFSFGYGIVCPLVLFHLAMVLCVLLSFFIWPWYCVYTCPFSFMVKWKRTSGHTIPWPNEKGQEDTQYHGQMKKDKRTHNTIAKWKRTRGHLFHLDMVFCFLLSFFIWLWHCVSSCPFSFGHGIVCPFVHFHLAMVLCVLLSFFIWPWYCVSSCPFSFGHGIVCPLVLFHLAMDHGQMKKDKRTNNTMAKWKRTRGHTIPWPNEKGQEDTQYHGLAMVLCVHLSFFIWPWYCLSFCPFSFGHGIVCPLVLAKWKWTKGHTIPWPNEKGQEDTQYHGQMKKDKRTHNTMAKWKRTKGQTFSF